MSIFLHSKLLLYDAVDGNQFHKLAALKHQFPASKPFL